MKIIDILNKKANGTLKDGFKFKFAGRIFTYSKKDDVIQEKLGWAIGEIRILEQQLNETVEVIEENKEIEEVENISYNFTKTSYTAAELSKNFETITELLNKQSNKISELVRVINKINKGREVK